MILKTDVCLDEATSSSLVNSLKLKSNLRKLNLKAGFGWCEGVVEKVAELLNIKTLTKLSVNGLASFFLLDIFLLFYKIDLGVTLTRSSANAIANHLTNKENLKCLSLFCKKKHNTTQLSISFRRHLIAVHMTVTRMEDDGLTVIADALIDSLKKNRNPMTLNIDGKSDTFAITERSLITL